MEKTLKTNSKHIEHIFTLHHVVGGSWVLGSPKPNVFVNSILMIMILKGLRCIIVMHTYVSNVRVPAYVLGRFRIKHVYTSIYICL